VLDEIKEAEVFLRDLAERAAVALRIGTHTLWK
jgi:hypothetical protein